MTRRLALLIAFCLLPLALACGGDDDAESAAESAANSASDMMDQAKNAADSAMDQATDAANRAGDAVAGAAASVAGDAVASCRALAEQGAWGEALEVCQKAHELMPNDLSLEHAYQQAQAAAAH